MADEIAGWEVISQQVNKHSFFEMLIGIFAGERVPATIKFTVLEKATGIKKTITGFGLGELPERIANKSFDP